MDFDLHGSVPELIDFWREKQVVCGVDMPSVDLADDENLISHQTILKQNIGRYVKSIVLDEGKTRESLSYRPCPSSINECRRKSGQRAFAWQRRRSEVRTSVLANPSVK